MTKFWHNLNDYIRDLLRDGKRSGHEDFQILIRIFGKEKITEIALRILEEEKKLNGGNA